MAGDEEKPSGHCRLLGLPNELILNILSFLPPGDLDKQRRTCRKLREIIDGSDKQLYARRLLPMSVYIEENNCLTIEVTCGWNVKILLEEGTCSDIKAEPLQRKMTTNKTRDKQQRLVENWRKGVHATFCKNQLSFVEMYKFLSKRFGGNDLCIRSDLTLSVLHSILPILKETKELDIVGHIRLTREETWHHVLSVRRRKLALHMNALWERPDLVDERFCRDLPCSELVIDRDRRSLFLTDELYMTLVTRPDLSSICISSICGPTARTIRMSIQKLLRSSLDVSIKLKGALERRENFKQAKRQLQRRNKKEWLDVSWENRDEDRTILYTLKDRRVIVVLKRIGKNDRSIAMRSWTEYSVHECACGDCALCTSAS